MYTKGGPDSGDSDIRIKAAMEEGPEETKEQHNFSCKEGKKTDKDSTLNGLSMMTTLSFTNNIAPPKGSDKSESCKR